ncbi:MAG: cupredoxin domain-containing protein [Gaiellaceae bacterium]
MRFVWTVLALICALALAAPASAALGRKHRPIVPPAAEPPLANALAVDEFEFILRPSKRVVAAGTVRINIYNRGEDDHNLVVVDADGLEHRTDIGPLESGRLEPVLTPGTYEVFCDLFAGTPESHYDLGMVFDLEVK